MKLLSIFAVFCIVFSTLSIHHVQAAEDRGEIPQYEAPLCQPMNLFISQISSLQKEQLDDRDNRMISVINEKYDTLKTDFDSFRRRIIVVLVILLVAVNVLSYCIIFLIHYRLFKRIELLRELKER